MHVIFFFIFFYLYIYNIYIKIDIIKKRIFAVFSFKKRTKYGKNVLVGSSEKANTPNQDFSVT